MVCLLLRECCVYIYIYVYIGCSCGVAVRHVMLARVMHVLEQLIRCSNIDVHRLTPWSYGQMS